MVACIKGGSAEPVPTCNRQCGRSKNALCFCGGFLHGIASDRISAHADARPTGLGPEPSLCRLSAPLNSSSASPSLYALDRPPSSALHMAHLAHRRSAAESSFAHARQRAPLVGDRVVALETRMLGSAIGSAHHMHVPLDTYCRASAARHAHIRQSPPLPCRCHGDVSYISLLFRSESPIGSLSSSAEVPRQTAHGRGRQSAPGS